MRFQINEDKSAPEALAVTVKYLDGFTYATCRCGWAIHASGSHEINLWAALEIMRHGKKCKVGKN